MLQPIRAAVRLPCAIVAIALLGASEPPGRALCGDAIASGPQRGTFQKIALGSQCDTKQSTGPAVSLSVGNVAPIFWIGQLVDGECRMTLATIENDAFAPIARTSVDLGDQAPADAGNGQYWSNTAGHAAYLHLDTKHHTEAIVELISPNSRARSLAADESGNVYALEIALAGTVGPRLADLATRSAQVLPPATYTKSFLRGADGRLYFERYYLRQALRSPCSLFVIDGRGRASEMTTCDLTGETTVGASGTMWDATELGVVLRDPASGAQTIYAPVFAPPCNNFTPSSSYTHDIVADPRGNAWFVLDRLWHVDRRGKVTSVEIPERSLQEVATRGLFETADGTLWLFSKNFVEHFVP